MLQETDRKIFDNCNALYVSIIYIPYLNCAGRGTASGTQLEVVGRHFEADGGSGVRGPPA
jgi:hypothetical protein